MNNVRTLFIIVTLLIFKVGSIAARKSDTISAKKWEFIENRTHLPKNVKYFSKFNGGAIFFEDKGYTITLCNPRQLEAFHEAKHDGKYIDMKSLDLFAYHIDFLGANLNPKISNSGKYNYHYNYFIGKDEKKWDSKLSVFREITYENIYDNVDLKFTSNNDHLKYEFHVYPNGNTSHIAMHYSGLKNIVKSGGELLLYSSWGRNVELKPFAYQIDEQGDTSEIKCNYVLKNNIVYFDVGNYDKTRVLIIDPTIVFSSYSGSTADNWGYTATYDIHGNLYGGGIAFDIGYPTTLGAFQVDYNGNVDIAISKFSSDGSTLYYSTYLGGSNVDIPHSLFVNNNDELYIFGTTSSSDYPTTENAYDTIFNGGTPCTLSTARTYPYGSDIIISKLNIDGSQLLASTFVGGSGNDGLNISQFLRKNYADENRGEIELDNNSNVYVVSSTLSTDFPTTQYCYKDNYSGGLDVCIFKMSQDLSTLIWSSYIGSSGDDAGYSLSFGNDNSIYICGGTTSTDLCTIQGLQSSQADNGSDVDGFIAHFSHNGTALEHFTYLGRVGYDQAYLIESDRDGNIYTFGQTAAQGTSWVANANYFIPNGGQFIVKLRNNLTDLVWSTAVGSGNIGPDISPTAFMTDVCNNIYISGWGSSQLNGFGGTFGLPITADAIQNSTDGSDFYFLTLDDDASELIYASYFGGNDAREHVDGGTSRFDKHGFIYQAVCAGCGGLNSFPTTPGAFSQINGSTNCNLGVVKINFSLPTVIADFQIPTVVCIPDSVSFTNNSQIISQQASVLWDFGDGYTSSEWNPTHKFLTPGVYTVTLTIHDIQSCNIYDTLKKNIFVFANTTTNLSDMNICNTEYAELGMPPASDVNYHWYPETSLNNPNLSNPIATPTNTTTYMLIAETNTCVDTFYQTVIIHSLDVEIATQSQDMTICLGDNATISVNIYSDDNFIIQWSETSDFQNIIATNTTSLQVSPEATKTYYVRVSSQYCTKITPITVSVSTIDVSLQRKLLCFENTVQLSAEVSSSYPPYQYYWDVDAFGSSSEESPIFNVTHSCNYAVTVTNAVGCSATAVNEIIVAENSFSEEFDAWCEPQEIFEFQETILFVTDLGNSYTYHWTPSVGLVTPDSTATIATPLESTIYTIHVTDHYGCSKSDTVFVKVNPIYCREPFVFIPNSFTPNGDGINDLLFVRSDILVEIYFVIYNRWGEKIFETSQQNESWDGTFKSKDCQQGVYDYYLRGRCRGGDEIELKGNVTLIR